jgi:hypothetical protein
MIAAIFIFPAFSVSFGTNTLLLGKEGRAVPARSAILVITERVYREVNLLAAEHRARRQDDSVQSYQSYS